MTIIETFETATLERTDATAIDTPIEEVVPAWERSTGCAAIWDASEGRAYIAGPDGLTHHFFAAAA